MLLVQSRSVYEILAGKDSGWSTQRRTDGSLPFSTAFRKHLGHTAFGAVLLAAALALSPILAAWMAPTIIGLLLSVPLSHLSGLAASGVLFRRLGLLLTPEETAQPLICTAAQAERAALASSLPAAGHPLSQLLSDSSLFDQHLRALPSASRMRGGITATRALADAKISEARNRLEAMAWLAPNETALVMGDQGLLRDFAALPES
jgi:membrane glycosyltransferase